MILLASYLLVLSWIPISLQNNTTFRENGNNDSNLERSYVRTQSLIEQRTHSGRMVLLVCRRRHQCQRARTSIPQWVRDINEENKYDGLEVIHYHFYVMGQKLPFMNSTSSLTFPMVTYIMGETPYYYQGELLNQKSFKSWLKEMDNVNIVRPSEYSEMNDLLASADGNNCTSKYLVLINNHKECPFEEWPIIARYIMKEENIIPIELESPLPTEMSVLISRRMRLLPSSHCRLLFLIYTDSYSVPIDAETPQEVAEAIHELVPNVETQLGCTILDESLWSPLRPPLTELEMIYYSGDFHLKAMETDAEAMVIGITGGVAVGLLGYSIFKGLNGGSFAE